MIHRNTVYILILLIIIILFVTKNNQYSDDSDDSFDQPDSFDGMDKHIIIRQSARWSLAAKQDMNPVIGLLHANYGTAYQLFLIMNDIMEKTLFEKTVTIEKNIIINLNNLCKDSQQLNDYQLIGDLIMEINLTRRHYGSNNTIIRAFQLIDLINRYSSEHSDDPLIGLICANYCSGVYWAINDIRTSTQIESKLRLYMESSEQKFTNIRMLRDMLIDKQDKVTLNYSKICVHYNIDEIGDDYLAKIAGNK